MNHVLDIADLDPALSKLIGRFLTSDEVVMEDAGKPVARIVRVPGQAPPSVSGVPFKRVPGMLRHLVGPEPEGFFDPLTDEELEDWLRDPEPSL